MKKISEVSVWHWSLRTNEVKLLIHSLFNFFIVVVFAITGLSLGGFSTGEILTWEVRIQKRPCNNLAKGEKLP